MLCRDFRRRNHSGEYPGVMQRAIRILVSAETEMKNNSYAMRSVAALFRYVITRKREKWESRDRAPRGISSLLTFAFPYLLSATHQRTSATAHAPVSANTLDLAVHPEVTRQPGGTRNAALRTQ